MKINAMTSRIAAVVLLALASAISPVWAENAAVTVGDLTISHGFTRAMPPHAPVAGGYLSITNAGARDARLTGAQSPVAARVEIHEMTMNGSVMKMRALPDGLPIPAGQTVQLAPGGVHLMFIGVTAPFVEAQTIPLTLSFDQASDISLSLPVGPINARSGKPIDAGSHAGH